MGAALLLLVVFAAWVLIFAAAGLRKAVEDARRGVPEGERSGVIAAPIIPVFPLAVWGLALLADRVVPPWGTGVVGSIHAIGVAVSVALISWRIRLLRSLD